MSRLVLGLDVSTSCTGICILDAGVAEPVNGNHIRLLDRIEFKKCKNFWDKTDEVEKKLSEFKNSGITEFCLEEPLLGFSKGMSSAATITTLMRFNGIVSYIARGIFGIDPIYIAAASARKLAGVKLQKTAIAGMSHKEQVFKHMMENDLKHVEWPKKKSGADVDWSRDATDSYVIARAACLMHKHENK